MARTVALIGCWLMLACLICTDWLSPAGSAHDLTQHDRSLTLATTETQHAFAQENSSLLAGSGIKAHWNLSALIGSGSNSFDSAVADIDSDGIVEVIVSRNAQCEFFCLKADGRIVWQTPLLSTHAPGYYGSEVVDIEGDGELEFVAVSDSIWVLDADTGTQEWSVPDVGGLPEEVPWTLGHITSPAHWNIVIARTQGNSFVVSVYDWAGHAMWNTAIADATYGHTLTASDVDGDGYDEVFVPCSTKTVAIDHNGGIMWAAPLTPSGSALTEDFRRSQDLPSPQGLDGVTDWWYHSDFAEVTDLYGDGRYFVVHDYGGGVLDPTMIQVLDALTGQVVGSFQSSGHHQGLRAAELRADLPGRELVYTTREAVVMRGSTLEVVWEMPLSGAHSLGLGDWNGDGADEVMASTVDRGVHRFAGIDSNFLVIDSWGEVIYNMLFQYPPGEGKYAGAQMATAMRAIRDWDLDGRADVPVCFSNHDLGKFASSRDVHQYIMSPTDSDYRNEFHAWGNTTTAVTTGTLLLADSLALGYRVPEEEFSSDVNVGLLMHMNEGSGSFVGDSSSNGNNGTLYRGEWVEEGRFGSAIRFNGVDTVLGVPYDASLSSPTVTIEVWAKAHYNGQTQTLVEKPGAFGLYITGDGNLWFWFYDPSAMRGSGIEVEAPYAAFDRFAEIVASYDGESLRLMVDGELVAADEHRGAIDQIHIEPRGLNIGNNHNESVPFDGVIDELRVTTASRPLARLSSGVWVSEAFSVETGGLHYGSLALEQDLRGGSISFDLLKQDYTPLPGHTNVVSSPHFLGDIAGPIRIRVNLVRGGDIDSSPTVENLYVTARGVAFLPWIATNHPGE